MVSLVASRPGESRRQAWSQPPGLCPLGPWGLWAFRIGAPALQGLCSVCHLPRSDLPAPSGSPSMAQCLSGSTLLGSPVPRPALSSTAVGSGQGCVFGAASFTGARWCAGLVTHTDPGKVVGRAWLQADMPRPATSLARASRWGRVGRGLPVASQGSWAVGQISETWPPTQAPPAGA